jgi:hypothetical protein
MSEAALKAVQLEFVLCQMRNLEVTWIDASSKGFDDQDAIKIGEGLRYVFILVSGVFLFFSIFATQKFPVFQKTFLWRHSIFSAGYWGNIFVCVCTFCSQNTSLETLYLGSNKIGDAGAASIGDALTYVVFVRLGGNFLFLPRHPIFLFEYWGNIV